MENWIYLFSIYLMLFSLVHDACGYTEDIPGIAKEEIRIILIGRTGVGKSATGNTILGRRAFESKIGGESVTKKTAFNTTRRFDHKIVVVDTPGLADRELTDNEVKAEIVKSFTITSPGPHAFLLLLRPGRISREEQDTLEIFQNFFGNAFKEYLIVAFTDKEQLKKEKKTIEEYIDTLKEGHPLKTLLNDVGNRYINIGYSDNFEDPDRISEIKKIVDFVVKIKNKLGFLKTEFTDRTEAIYQRIVDIKIDLQEVSISETNDSKSNLERFRDYVRKELLGCYLGVAVNAFIRTFQGNHTEFTLRLLDMIYENFFKK